MSYDIKYRKQTVEYLKRGHTYRETSKLFGVSPNTLARWVKKLRQTGELEDPKRRPAPRKIFQNQLEEYLSANPDAYQSEVAEHFNCTQQSISRVLKKWGYTRKKR